MLSEQMEEIEYAHQVLSKGSKLNPNDKNLNNEYNIFRQDKLKYTPL